MFEMQMKRLLEAIFSVKEIPPAIISVTAWANDIAGVMYELLDERERLILMQSYGVGGKRVSLTELARRLEIHASRVGQLRTNALGKLRQHQCVRMVAVELATAGYMSDYTRRWHNFIAEYGPPPTAVERLALECLGQAYQEGAMLRGTNLLLRNSALDRYVGFLIPLSAMAERAVLDSALVPRVRVFLERRREDLLTVRGLNGKVLDELQTGLSWYRLRLGMLHG